jgi:hypothetical protein
MYEMEGPRPAFAAPAAGVPTLPIARLPILRLLIAQLPSSRPPIRLLIAQLPSSRLPLPRSHPVARGTADELGCAGPPDCAVLLSHHRCQIPAVGASLPALPAFPEFPPGRSPSSVVRDFYCETGALHKAFPRYLQDSLVIHKTSGVYPPCTVDFHRRMHKLSTTSVDTAAMRVKAQRIAAANQAPVRITSPGLVVIRCRERGAQPAQCSTGAVLNRRSAQQAQCSTGAVLNRRSAQRETLDDGCGRPGAGFRAFGPTARRPRRDARVQPAAEQSLQHGADRRDCRCLRTARG